MRRHALALALVAFAARPAAAGPVAVSIVGDDLSDYYFHYQGASNPDSGGLPYWGAKGDRNWAEQLLKARGPALTVYNYAGAGATTADLLDGDSTKKAAIRTKYFNAYHAVVTAGATDVLAFFRKPGDPADLAKSVGDNVGNILAKIDAAGPVHLVVSNIPDLTIMPTVKGLLKDAALLGQLGGLIQTANDAIAKAAAAHGAAVVDLYALSQAAASGLVLAGTDVPGDKAFAADGFHPGSVLQGLFGNAILAAFGDGIADLRLTDQEVLKAAGLDPTDDKPSYYDVSGYVHKTPEPASAMLLLLAAGVAGVRRRRRSLRTLDS